MVAFGALQGCNCGSNPPPMMGVTPVPTGTNAVACSCSVAAATCGLGCCDPMTGPPGSGLPACTNSSCSTISCCDNGTGGPGQPACTSTSCSSVIGCCDMGTGGPGQPSCAHSMCNRVGNCSSRLLSVCVPPNTADLSAFCNTMCQTHARSAAVVTGLDSAACPFLTVTGGALPKGSATAPIAWNDAMCTGACTMASGGCNVDSDCGPGGGTCTAATCPAITCTALTAPPFTNNFCFGATGPTCCNVVPSSCGESSPPICRPAMGDPPGYLTAFYSLTSSGIIDPSASTITVVADDGSGATVTPHVRGEVDFNGRPCPGGSCSVGVTFEVFVDDFNALGASFSSMTLSAGTTFPALSLSPLFGSQFGTMDGTNLTLTAQGTASKHIVFGINVGGTQAIKSQPLPGVVSLDFQVDWVNNTFTMTSTSPFSFPGSGDIPAFTASLAFSGHLVNQPPAAVTAPALSVACDAPTSGTATLDGRDSSDPDRDVLTASWLNGPEVVGTFVGHDPRISVAAPFTAPGPTTTHYTLQVEDGEGQVDTAKVAVTVSDTTAPVISASVSPDCLWAPSHGLVLLRVGTELVASSQDVCSPAPPAVYILDVQSDQAELGGGQGDFAPDVLFGTGAVCLRSEREGTAAAHQPRTYTITLAADDASGNRGTTTVQVRVPHDQSGTKCPKTPASLIVPDGDPRCTQALPGAPTASLAPPAPPAAPPSGPGGCSSVGVLATLPALLLLRRRRSRARA